MAKVYLKTLISSIYEAPYIYMNAVESERFVDKFLVFEFNKTHTGEDRPYIWNDVRSMLPKDVLNKLEYVAVDLNGKVELAINDSSAAHRNEDIMRGYINQYAELNRRDIVMSVDADEIIFSHSYEPILNSLGLFTRAVKLELYQFFYRVDCYWRNNRFVAPTVCYGDYYKGPNHRWRYDGRLFKEPVGAHFSWCIPIAEMVRKISKNAHQADYQHLVGENVLLDAVRNMAYPFDPSLDVRMLNVSVEDFGWLYPDCMQEAISRFDLLGDST